MVAELVGTLRALTPYQTFPVLNVSMNSPALSCSSVYSRSPVATYWPRGLWYFLLTLQVCMRHFTLTRLDTLNVYRNN